MHEGRVAQRREARLRREDEELDYRLIEQQWARAGARIAARFAYVWHDDSGKRKLRHRELVDDDCELQPPRRT